MQTDKEISSPHKAKVVISKNLAAQIQFLHSHCPHNTEWSGLLIWKLEEGSIENLENVKIKAEAVFPMDYGDATFTSFEGDSGWLDCFRLYPQVDPINPQPGWYISKIHSHNSMGVFHSGTDKSDLQVNAHKLPMFLSLIVNYKCETDCELAIAVEIEETLLSRVKWKLKGWKDTKRKYEKVKNDKKSIYVLDCDVEYEQDQWMIDRCIELKQKKNRVQTITQHSSYNYKPKNVGPENKSTTPRQFVVNKTIQHIASLITLGEAHTGMTLKEAIDRTNMAVELTQKDVYTKALKIYFVDYWYDMVFYTMTATAPTEVIDACLVLMKSHTGWIVTRINEALNELKAEYPKLWEVQEPSVV